MLKSHVMIVKEAFYALRKSKSSNILIAHMVSHILFRFATWFVSGLITITSIGGLTIALSLFISISPTPTTSLSTLISLSLATSFSISISTSESTFVRNGFGGELSSE